MIVYVFLLMLCHIAFGMDQHQHESLQVILLNQKKEHVPYSGIFCLNNDHDHGVKKYRGRIGISCIGHRLKDVLYSTEYDSLHIGIFSMGHSIADDGEIHLEHLGGWFVENQDTDTALTRCSRSYKEFYNSIDQHIDDQDQKCGILLTNAQNPTDQMFVELDVQSREILRHSDMPNTTHYNIFCEIVGLTGIIVLSLSYLINMIKPV
jgi:hypothetical protein